MNRQYLCSDLKSVYTSVEHVERGLVPMITYLIEPVLYPTDDCSLIGPSFHN